MKKVKTFALGYPLLFSIIVTVLSVVLEIVPVKYVFKVFINEPYASYFGDITMRGIICIFLIFMLKYFGIFRMAGFTRPNSMKSIFLVWPYLLVILLNLSDVITGKAIIDISNGNLLLTYAFDSLSIGFFEEILVRGFILALLLNKWGDTKKGIYLSVISSSLIFGLAHIINLIQNPTLFIATITQILYATFMGVVFASFVLRIQTIWSTIILHSLFDFAGNITQISVGGGIAMSEAAKASTSISNAIVAIIITFPLFLYGLFILRKVNSTYVNTASINI